MRALAISAVATLTVLSCVACGGGGGGESSAPSQPVAAKPTCYVNNPNPGKPCIVDDDAVSRSILNVGDTNRLKSLFSKMEKGGTYTVAFIGGSITRGERVIETPDKQYTWIVTNWLKAKFPKATINYVNAAISGTDAKSGDERLDTDLLPHKPDLVVTEWAVNNSQITQDQVWYHYGNVVDRILAQPNSPAIIMLITMIGDGLTFDYKDIPVGMSRNLPIVSAKAAIFEKQKAGEFASTDWCADTVHPNELGMSILGTLVTKYLERQL